MACCPRSHLLAIAIAVVGLGSGACGEEDIQLAESDPNYEGAKIFQQSCSGCHTLDTAGTQGSAPNANDREYVDGPSFEARNEDVDQVLYAIRNGGFSSGPMPQNIVVGKEAEEVARFIAENSGKQADKPASP